MTNRIYFSVPNSSDVVPQQFASSFAYNLANLVRAHPDVDYCVQDYLSNLSIAAARNREIHVAMANGADWIWFLDIDHRFPPAAFVRLYESALELLKSDKQFIELSALYYGRTGEMPPMGTFLEHPELKDPEKFKVAREAGQIIQSSTVPTGCTLINLAKAKQLYDRLADRGNGYYKAANTRRELMAKKKKCTETELVALNNEIARAVNYAPALFVGQYTPLGQLVTTEDYFFSRLASSEGFNCFIDLGCEVQHKIRDYWFPAHRETEPILRPKEGSQFVIRGQPQNGIVAEALPPAAQKIAEKAFSLVSKVLEEVKKPVK